MSYLTGHGTRATSQSASMREDQVPNSAGGFAWAVDSFTRLRRFLILGSEGGSYYASQRKLTTENVGALAGCIKTDGLGAVKTIAEISHGGRAPKNDAAIFALAYCVAEGDDDTKRMALAALPQVCRTSTHLFMFADFLDKSFGKLTGRAKRRAIGNWYAQMTPEKLAYQAVKYRQRDGMTHRDLLRLSHPASEVTAGNPTIEVSEAHRALFAWIVGKGVGLDTVPKIIEGYVRIRDAGSAAEAAKLVVEYGLPREAVPTDFLTTPEVWEALLATGMPLTAMIRNLANMTRAGVLTPTSFATGAVIETLGDAEALKRARIHPINVLMAMRTYEAGRGFRGSNTWDPVVQIVDALDGAFYTSFGNVEKTGKRFLLALDVSGSMTGGSVAGVPNLTPRDAAAALALVTANVEPMYETVGFFSGSGGYKSPGRMHYGYEDGLTPLTISPRQRLTDAVKAVSDLPFGGTDCALPMLYAMDRGREVDAFVIYTDSETWAGGVHPAQALREYRRQSGIDARLIVVGMVSNGFTIADPDDAGMMDVVGFDTATPNLIGDFAAGRI